MPKRTREAKVWYHLQRIPVIVRSPLLLVMLLCGRQRPSHPLLFCHALSLPSFPRQTRKIKQGRAEGRKGEPVIRVFRSCMEDSVARMQVIERGQRGGNHRTSSSPFALFASPNTGRTSMNNPQPDEEKKGDNDEDNRDDTKWEVVTAAVVDNNDNCNNNNDNFESDDSDSDDIDNNNNDEWLPDRERAKRQRQERRMYVERITETTTSLQTPETEPEVKQAPTPYTDEEEEIIAAMGGRTRNLNQQQQQQRRQPGYLGDSTLAEICTDYSVPICYLADVLCMWGVPPPIHVQDRLGDLVTGEQAFSILEAVNSLDIAALHDRYSNTNLLNVAAEWDIDIKAAFEMAMEEGWSLPFGVRTCLRVEQEEELIRVLGNPLAMTRNTFDDDDYDSYIDDDDE